MPLTRSHAYGAKAYNCTRGSSPSAIFQDWIRECNAWRERVLQVLTEHFEYAVAEWFEDIGPFPLESFVHAIDDEHRHQLNMLAHSLRTLGRLIEQNTRFVRITGVDGMSSGESS